MVPKSANPVCNPGLAPAQVVTAAHTLGSVSLGDPSTEVVPAVTGVQRKVLDEMEEEDGEILFALREGGVGYG